MRSLVHDLVVETGIGFMYAWIEKNRVCIMVMLSLTK